MTTVKLCEYSCSRIKAVGDERLFVKAGVSESQDLRKLLNRAADPNAREDQLATPERTSRTKAT